MAKEEMYHIALDDYEHGIIIRSLNDEKTDLMNEGKSTDALDAASIFYAKSELWIDSEKLYEVLYEMEV